MSFSPFNAIAAGISAAVLLLAHHPVIAVLAIVVAIASPIMKLLWRAHWAALIGDLSLRRVERLRVRLGLRPASDSPTQRWLDRRTQPPPHRQLSEPQLADGDHLAATPNSESGPGVTPGEPTGDVDVDVDVHEEPLANVAGDLAVNDVKVPRRPSPASLINSPPTQHPNFETRRLTSD